MTTVALIGADGAGKTTVAQRIADRSRGRIRYVYMGMNAQANPYALPTSRLVLALKRRRHSRSRPVESTDADDRDLGHTTVGSGRLIAGLRLVNRVLEEWFRLFIVLRIQRRGQIVICDRHFVLDHALGMLMGKPNSGRLSERIHRWTLFRFYPRPDLVVFLDAPAETLYERKKDAPLDYLRARQRAYREATYKLPGFVSVDGARSLDEVTIRVEEEIARFGERTRSRFSA